MRTAVVVEVSTGRLERVLQSGEAIIARIRAVQMETLAELDRRQVALVDGSRTLSEWVAARMDVTSDTALKLTRTARRLADQPGLAAELADLLERNLDLTDVSLVGAQRPSLMSSSKPGAEQRRTRGKS